MKKRILYGYLATLLLVLLVPFAASSPDPIETLTGNSPSNSTSNITFSVVKYIFPQSVADNVSVQMLSVAIGITCAYFLAITVAFGITKLRRKNSDG